MWADPGWFIYQLVVRIWLWSSAAWPSTFLFFSFSTLYSGSLWVTDKIGTRGGGGEGIIEGIKETPAIRKPILLNRTVWVGRGGWGGWGGEFSPSSLLNLATANTSNCVPQCPRDQFVSVPSEAPHTWSQNDQIRSLHVFSGTLFNSVTLNSLRRPLDRLLLLP